MKMVSFTCSALLALGLLAAVPAGAQEKFPSRPITIIVPFPPGGAADIQVRIIGKHLSARLSQPVVVETSSHAGGTPAAPQAAPVQSRIPPIRTAVDTLLGRGPSGHHPGLAPELPGTASARTKKKARASRRAHEQVLARARKSC